jgi:hypothetical protein
MTDDGVESEGEMKANDEGGDEQLGHLRWGAGKLDGGR